MNREERRRRERQAARGGREKMIDVSRLPAEVQDFRAGTIFAAGAADLSPTGGGLDAPPIFVVLLDKTAFKQCPELLTLFGMPQPKGTVALHSEIRATRFRPMRRARCWPGWTSDSKLR